MTIGAAALDITANVDSKTYGQTKTYGAGSTAFTSSGLQNGETIGSMTITASGGSAANAAVGSYSLTPSAAAGGTFSAGNYTIAYHDGALTVNAAALDVTANADSKTYGQTKTYGAGSTAFTSSGLQNGETIGSVTITAGGGTAATAAVGSYNLTPSAAAGGTFAAGNYTIAYHDGTLTIIKADQTITFGALPDKLTTDAPFTVSATAGSGLAVTFSLVSGPATMLGNTITLNGTAGTVVVQTVQEGNTNYNAGPSVNQSFNVVKADQTIAFNALANKTYGNGTVALSATASSGLAVSFSILLGPATINGNTLTILGAGNVTVRASQAGNSMYNAAPSVDQPFSVAQAALTITADNQTRQYGQPNPVLTAAYSGFVSGDSAAVLDTPVTLATAALAASAPGPYAITASGAADANYAVTEVNGTLTITKADQAIAFGALPDKVTTDTPFIVSAAANSGLAVTFSIVSGPAAIAGNSITLNGTAGTVVVQAVQAGDANYNAAPSVNQSFNVANASQTITLDALANRTYGDAPFTVSATASSGLPVSFSILLGPAAINGNTLTILGAGNVTVRASQAGNGAYNAAPSVDQSFGVARAIPAISWDNPADVAAGTALSAIQLNATASVPGTFAYFPAEGTVLAIGANHGLSTLFIPADTANYAPATATAAINVVNAAPVIVSQPTAAPNPAVVEQTVTFTVYAGDPDNDALAYAWTFGDGTSGTGAVATHVYTATGNFTATVAVTDAAGLPVSGSVALTVELGSSTGVSTGGGTGGGALPPLGLVDSDGDGFPDEVEAALGSDPTDPASTPLGLPHLTTTGPLSVSVLNIKLNFARPRRDGIFLSGLLVIPDGFNVPGQKLIVDIGGVVRGFSLNSKGSAKQGNDSCALGVKAKKGVAALQVAKFTVKLTKGSFTQPLANYGLVNRTVSTKLSVPVTVIFNGTLLQKSVPQKYKASAGRTGATK
ncbi:MAG: MBG domain-containing protein [Planctomycetota bacterium]